MFVFPYIHQFYYVSRGIHILHIYAALGKCSVDLTTDMDIDLHCRIGCIHICIRMCRCAQHPVHLHHHGHRCRRHLRASRCVVPVGALSHRGMIDIDTYVHTSMRGLSRGTVASRHVMGVYERCMYISQSGHCRVEVAFPATPKECCTITSLKLCLLRPRMNAARSPVCSCVTLV